MEDAGNNFHSSKKRSAGIQLTPDNPDLDDNETSDTEKGTFRRASDEVLATRRIVRVRRQQPSSTPSAPDTDPTPANINPFAAIRLVPPTSSDISVTVECRVTGKETEENDNTDSKYETAGDEPKVESTAEEKTDVINENNQQSESKADESKVEQSAEKDETDQIYKNSGDGGRNYTETDASENEAKDNAEGKKNDNEEKSAEKTFETVSFSSFKPLSSGQNAFSGFSGTGFSSTSSMFGSIPKDGSPLGSSTGTFSFGSIPKDGSPLGSSMGTFSFGSIPKDGSLLGSTTGSLFGPKNDVPNFGFGVSNNGTSSVFGTSGVNNTKKEGNSFPSMKEVPVETGEENEETVFSADSVLFEYVAGTWKERGKGELKVNISTTGTSKARLVMRSRGNYRLILNASLYPDLKLTNMDKRGITFACVNSASEGKDSLSTIALKFKDAPIVEEFRTVVTEHKTQSPVALKTSENSPKASDV